MKPDSPKPLGDVIGGNAETCPPIPPQTKPSNRSLIFDVAIPMALLAIAGLCVLLMGKSKPPQRPPNDNSRVGILKRLPAADVKPILSLDELGGRLNLSVDGVVVPFRETQIAAEVSGRIVHKSPICEAGNYVDKGQLLFRIDPQDYQLEQDRLVRVAEQEKQQILEIDQEISNNLRMIKLADQDLALQQRELKRTEALPEGYASDGEVDQTRRAVLQAIQAQATLQNQLSLLRKRRARLETSEHLARIQLEVAKLNLARTEIYSPVDGIIVREDAELNSFIQRGSPVLTVEDTSKVEVAVNLRMDQLYWVLNQQTDFPPGDSFAAGHSGNVPRLNQGYTLPVTDATIQYTFAGREDHLFRWSGRLLRYDGIGLDEQTRTVPVRIVVDNPKRRVGANGDSISTDGPSALVRGMFVTATLHINPRSKLVAIPAAALKPGNQIWRFSPDASALIQPSSTLAKPSTSAGPFDQQDVRLVSKSKGDVAEPPSEKKSESAESDKLETSGFQPQAWVPGWVDVVSGVRPIESILVPTADKGNPIRRSAQTKYWVCEVKADPLQSGDKVVVTPLSSVSSQQAIPIRIPIEKTN